MKKIFLALCAMLVGTGAFAQNFKSLVSDIDYDVTVGFGSSACDKYYDKGKSGLTVGIDARKPIFHYPNEASTIYGLVGLHYVIKGGSDSNDIWNSSQNKKLVATHLQLPIHPGFSYQFKKFSLYIDFGPYIGVKIGENSENNKSKTELSSMEFGVGSNLGIRFKRFAIGFGSERGLTKFATYIDSTDGEMNLKNNTGHIDLKWTF